MDPTVANIMPTYTSAKRCTIYRLRDASTLPPFPHVLSYASLSSLHNAPECSPSITLSFSHCVHTNALDSSTTMLSFRARHALLSRTTCSSFAHDNALPSCTTMLSLRARQWFPFVHYKAVSLTCISDKYNGLTSF